MSAIAPGWDLSWDRAGDWLVAKLRCIGCQASDTPPAAQEIWTLMERQRTSQLVLDLSGVELLFSYLVGQLVMLYKRTCSHGGEIRLCGLSPRNREVLYLCRLEDHFPCYETREAALAGQKNS